MLLPELGWFLWAQRERSSGFKTGLPLIQSQKQALASKDAVGSKASARTGAEVPEGSSEKPGSGPSSVSSRLSDLGQVTLPPKASVSLRRVIIIFVITVPSVCECRPVPTQD